METLYVIDTGYAYGGVVVRDGTVIDAPPIFRWMIGKSWSYVSKWKKIKTIWLNQEKING